MKIRSFLSPLLLSVLISINTVGQDISSVIQNMKNSITDVTIKDEIVEQSFLLEADECICKLSVHNIEDEEQLEYIFNAADINQYKIAFKTSKSSVYIETETKGGKDLVRFFENGEVEGYVDNFEFYAKDIEQARSIVEDFRNLVKECEKKQESIGFVLGGNPSIEDAANYLKNEITKVSVNEQTYDQMFSVNAEFVPSDRKGTRLNSSHNSE